MVLATRCHRQNMKINIINGSEVSRLSVAIQIPINIIPFGNDWGGNYFCLNKNDSSVIFYATDSFDPELSMDKNHVLVQKKLASSFKEFMDKLVTEEDLD
ncbi:integrase [Salmonella enterica subsp. enterica serovar Sanjuan]|uniref:Integrase n=1 Tax=Salmonella enterica subsp. enterica serovar Sanjuan TaxID=1160765 RepID=A0A3S4H1S7_SALET|nr:integrase [Salmonella enterica subsp. enterica serovar Sanjuan]